MHDFPKAPGTNYYRISALKQQKLFSRDVRTKVQESQGVNQPALTLEALREKTSLLLLASAVCPCSLICVHITPVSASVVTLVTYLVGVLPTKDSILLC